MNFALLAKDVCRSDWYLNEKAKKPFVQRLSESVGFKVLGACAVLLFSTLTV